MQNSVQTKVQTTQQQVKQQPATNYCCRHNNTIQQPCVTQYNTQQMPTANYQTQPQGQTLQVPNYSGVNIQIFNPSVGTPGGAPVYNVNAPQYQSPNCYPAGYYTNQYGNPQGNGNQNTSQNIADANSNQNTNNNSTTTNTNKTIIEEKKGKEKRKIVELTDPYIKNLENYLNSQDKEVRLMGAKEVVARLEEDESRKSDKALTALINKMLQDPAAEIRLMALAMLDSRCVTGDDYTVNILKAMQQSESSYGHDAISASEILLKMSGQTVEKEFEVKNDAKKKDNK